MALNLPKRSIDLLTSVDPDRGAARGLTGYWNVLAHALHMAGEYERQLTVAHEVRRRFPQEHRAFYYLANALAALGRLDELDAVLEESWLLASIPEFGPPGFALHVTVAQELAAHAHAEQAQAVLKRARRFHESSPPELMRIARHAAAVAQMFYLLHRLDEARVLLEPLTLEPVVSGAAWGMLGLVAVLQGDTSRAAEIERQLRDFARDSPYPDDKTGSLVSLARMAALEQRPEDAVGLLRQAVAAGLPYDSGIHVIWEFASLRGYPPFDEWLRPKG
jgi:tetratricopeptide (TPR) repeat protein